MAIRNIRRQATNPLASAGTPTTAPIYVDSDDNKLKMIPAGSGTTEVEVVDSSTNQTIGGNKTFTGTTVISGTVTSGATQTAGSGVSAAETFKTSVTREGNLIKTQILVDLTGLHGSTTDLDIIGNTGAASANFSQITAAVNGTIQGGKVTCLEVPAGGATDIDFYSANESTGTEDTLVTALVETALVTSGGAWTSGAAKGMTTVPPANDYIYITNGAGGSPNTFTAGKFLIELWGS